MCQGTWGSRVNEMDLILALVNLLVLQSQCVVTRAVIPYRCYGTLNKTLQWSGVSVWVPKLETETRAWVLVV